MCLQEESVLRYDGSCFRQDGFLSHLSFMFPKPDMITPVNNIKHSEKLEDFHFLAEREVKSLKCVWSCSQK